MKQYLKYRVWEWILCACIATGLVFALYSGFVLEDSFSSSVPKVGLFMLVAMAILGLLTRNRATIIAGIIAGVALLAFVVFYTHTHEVFGDESSETANSLFIAISVTVLAAVLVYLACRTRPGTIALFLVGNILICGAHFLQFPVELYYHDQQCADRKNTAAEVHGTVPADPACGNLHRRRCLLWDYQAT